MELAEELSEEYEEEELVEAREDFIGNFVYMKTFSGAFLPTKYIQIF